ncbi:hypothetical protein H6CHR_01768 [Variovorax sp. PBL-H6]|uniref:hypothetical protein n=1 Tax=Variovorax sp. PBL-H6 TaxID=434009 RepID=UPI001317C485|nr:hypothetical protein [Variovorax sp. PBL-H6]VTU22333.1 hypothetical protein H6CHR_01768 [Variovorax sp. PBL-H6]
MTTFAVNAVESALVPVPVPAHQLVLLDSEKQEVSDFKADLEAALHDVNEALKKSQETSEKVGKLEKKLQDRGWWEAVKDTFDGSTDKELTLQVMALSQGIALTQRVVRVVLKVQTQKNRLLQAFNGALVDKIANIEGDTRTLDSNQKVAALEFLGELRQQIEEQIRQQELVESHEHRLRAHEQWLFEVDNSRAESVRELARVEAGSTALKQRVDEIGQWQLDKDDHDAALREQFARSESDAANLKEQVRELEGRLARLEESARQMRSMKAMLIRQVLPLLALGFAVAALLNHLGQG